MMLSDSNLLALNVYEEANLEPDDGKAAVARVVKNRMALKFFSDGSIAGTILARDQFSWAWFGFETIHTGIGVNQQSKQEYIRVADTLADAEGVAVDRYDLAAPAALFHCNVVAQQAFGGTYKSTSYSLLTDDTVLYLNPRILTHLPTWAIPAAKVCSIGHHDFYRSLPAGAIA